MTGADLRASVARLEMTERGFGAAIGATPETVSRWINGHLPVPRPVAVLAHVLTMAKDRAPQADIAGLLRRAADREAGA